MYALIKSALYEKSVSKIDVSIITWFVMAESLILGASET